MKTKVIKTMLSCSTHCCTRKSWKLEVEKMHMKKWSFARRGAFTKEAMHEPNFDCAANIIVDFFACNQLHLWNRVSLWTPRMWFHMQNSWTFFLKLLAFDLGETWIAHQFYCRITIGIWKWKLTVITDVSAC